ncbi:hypothetical protein [Deinococcus reticulitermitis]|uniref:hypothetical protein n=1 Tax=Deinococcus reticulitermitis TaxID=856736 RepID=UPI001160BD70|nr:hypothetical protein [Deinococcus reticulitermitis]
MLTTLRVLEVQNILTPVQKAQIQTAHAHGLLDLEIAERTGVSLSSVKRVRKDLALPSNCPVNRRGRKGEQLVADAASRRGLTVKWRSVDGEKFDLTIQGLRVDVKAAAPSADGSWRFRLPKTRPSFYGQYTYDKDYAADTDIVILAALDTAETHAEFYILPSQNLPSHIGVRPGSGSDAHLDAWHLFPVSPNPLTA